MDQPTQLRILELSALLDLLEQNAHRVEELASAYGDPRTAKDCRTSFSSVYLEIESVRRELHNLKASFADYASRQLKLMDRSSFESRIN